MVGLSQKGTKASRNGNALPFGVTATPKSIAFLFGFIEGKILCGSRAIALSLFPSESSLKLLLDSISCLSPSSRQFFIFTFITLTTQCMRITILKGNLKIEKLIIVCTRVIIVPQKQVTSFSRYNYPKSTKLYPQHNLNAKPKKKWQEVTNKANKRKGRVEYT